MFGRVRWLGAALVISLAACGVEEKTDLSETGGSGGAGGTSGSGATAGSGGTGAAATGGIAGQNPGGMGGVAGSGTGGVGGVAGAQTGGTGGVVDPCSGACTDPNATCVAGVCLCNADFVNIDEDGNDQTADCKSTIVTGVSVTVGITHEACGNLVIKLEAPSTTVLTLMSRPGETEGSDDGMGGPGDMSNMVETSPVTFTDAATPGSETMGQGNPGDVVCQDTGVCEYNPDQGAAGGPATFGAAFDNSTATGMWRLCIGDAGQNDTGSLESWSVSVTTSNHTFTGTLSNLGLAIPDNSYNGSPASGICSPITL